MKCERKYICKPVHISDPPIVKKPQSALRLRSEFFANISCTNKAWLLKIVLVKPIKSLKNHSIHLVFLVSYSIAVLKLSIRPVSDEYIALCFHNLPMRSWYFSIQ